MSVAETTEVRRKLRAVRGELKVAKNTLIRRALKDTGYTSLEDKLGGPVGLIISTEDPVELAKDRGRLQGPRREVQAARRGSRWRPGYRRAKSRRFATLPPKEVIFAQLLGLLNAPATQLVRLLNEPGSGLVRLIDAIGKKNGEGAAAAAPAADAPPASEAPPAADAPPTDAAPSA